MALSLVLIKGNLSRPKFSNQMENLGLGKKPNGALMGTYLHQMCA